MKKNIALVFNILTNTIPLYGVLFLDWSPVMILFVFWQEAVVIGLWNVPKMLMAQLVRGLSAEERQSLINDMENPANDKISESDKKKIRSVISRGLDSIVMPFKLLLTLFFLVHYSLFMYGYSEAIRSIGSWLGTVEMPSFFSITLLIFFVSHGLSFLLNYYLGGEYRKANLNHQMFAPYRRVMILHVTFIFGMIFASATGSGDLLIAVFVIVKIIADVHIHIKSHAAESISS